MNRTILLLFFLLTAGLGFGQGKSVEILETFPVNAEVVGLLEDHNKLAVLRILKVDSNAYGLEKGSEILTEFYFTTGPMKNEAKLVGLSAGDKISVRLHARENRSRGRWDFMAFHYVVYEGKKE